MAICVWFFVAKSSFELDSFRCENVLVFNIPVADAVRVVEEAREVELVEVTTAERVKCFL